MLRPTKELILIIWKAHFSQHSRTRIDFGLFKQTGVKRTACQWLGQGKKSGQPKDMPIIKIKSQRDQQIRKSLLRWRQWNMENKSIIILKGKSPLHSPYSIPPINVSGTKQIFNEYMLFWIKLWWTKDWKAYCPRAELLLRCQESNTNLGST